MFSRGNRAVWTGIILLAGMFLAGQDTWAPPECVDNDADGYGNPASVSCAHPELDCNDADAQVNPGVFEGPDGDPKCGDGKDNDCDLTVDLNDLGCVACVDNDDDGYGVEASDNCTHSAEDCDDGNASVYPGAQEGPAGHATCGDSLDNDCDTLVDIADPQCTPSDMVLIPAGCYNMGDSFSEGTPDERPVHNVCLSAFAIDAAEVTNLEYIQCVMAAGCSAPSNFGSTRREWYYGNPDFNNHPVIYVGWDQADDYCVWAGKRLPTEAEWEYAARGGVAGNRYPWGNDIDCADADYGRWVSSDPCWNYGGLDNDTHARMSYPANGLGLYEMAGNVFEWVHDWYLANYYQTSPVNDPQGPATGTQRVYRGGAFTNVATALRVADRNGMTPSASNFNIGFRCAE